MMYFCRHYVFPGACIYGVHCCSEQWHWLLPLFISGMAQTCLHRYFASKSDSAECSAVAGKEPLAIAYGSNGQNKEAVQLLEEVVQIQKQTLAEDRPDRLTSQHAAENDNCAPTFSKPMAFTKVSRSSDELCIDEPAGEGRDGDRPTRLPGICIVQMEQCHINAVKQLTSTTMPMRYSDKFYKEAISDAEIGSLTRVALFDGQAVGWIRCRLESGADSPISGQQTPSQIYIQALCLLAPYRGYGVATRLLGSILQSMPVQGQRASSIYAHVWEQNEDALRWYERRGFGRVVLLDQYYRRLRPCGAWIVRRDLDGP